MMRLVCVVAFLAAPGAEAGRMIHNIDEVGNQRIVVGDEEESKINASGSEAPVSSERQPGFFGSAIAGLAHATGLSTGRNGSLHTKDNHWKIICPFLGTLVNEGHLAPQEEYTEEEMTQVSIKAGFYRIVAKAHSRANFKVLGSDKIDIFNMEGLPNEHLSSTGITDCHTDFFSCGGPFSSGPCKSNTPDKNCGVPNLAKFETFWTLADTNKDGKVNAAELRAVTKGRKGFIGTPVDSNPRAKLTMKSAYGLFFALFGEKDNEIAKERARRVLIDRRLPEGHKYPGPTVQASEFLFSPGGVGAFVNAFTPLR